MKKVSVRGGAAVTLCDAPEGRPGVIEMLKRSFDYKRIKAKVWVRTNHSAAGKVSTGRTFPPAMRVNSNLARPSRRGTTMEW